jgi:hypothetical protein
MLSGIAFYYLCCWLQLPGWIDAFPALYLGFDKNVSGKRWHALGRDDADPLAEHWFAGKFLPGVRELVAEVTGQQQMHGRVVLEALYQLNGVGKFQTINLGERPLCGLN